MVQNILGYTYTNLGGIPYTHLALMVPRIAPRLQNV